MNKKNKKGQEEMVGFALIVVLVTVILVIFLMIILYKAKSPGEINHYQLDGFVYSILSYTTDCSTSKQRNVPIKSLIAECMENRRCIDGRESCSVLNETVLNLVRGGWKTEGTPTAGYQFKVSTNEEENMINFLKGDTHGRTYMTSVQRMYIFNQGNVSISLTIWAGNSSAQF